MPKNTKEIESISQSPVHNKLIPECTTANTAVDTASHKLFISYINAHDAILSFKTALKSYNTAPSDETAINTVTTASLQFKYLEKDYSASAKSLTLANTALHNCRLAIHNVELTALGAVSDE